ncbi:MAG: alpha/beta hydrolase, partial [Gammaproteobacteria bacterium]|nr:alpha/beta hydrolase [Gammaproteobacteria bacterium]
ALVYGALLLFLYLYQSHLLFLANIPSRSVDATPADVGLAYEPMTLVASDKVKLDGWFLPVAEARGVILFCHGNAGNISHRRDSIELFHRLGLNIFIIDYRGYGKSRGKPDEQGLYLDAATAWRYLTEEKGLPNNQILIFGRSLGGAVAARLASGVQARALILESTLSSAHDFARAVFPVLSRLVVMRYDFNTAENIRRVHYPVLVLHSPADEIMPFHLGEKIFQAAHTPKHFVRMQGDHNNGFLQSQPEYAQEFDRWLQGIQQTMPAPS